MPKTDPLEHLALWAEEAASARCERNNAIRACREAGHSLRAIAEAAGLSVEAVRRIAAKSV